MNGTRINSRVARGGVETPDALAATVTADVTASVHARNAPGAASGARRGCPPFGSFFGSGTAGAVRGTTQSSLAGGIVAGGASPPGGTHRAPDFSVRPFFGSTVSPDGTASLGTAPPGLVASVPREGDGGDQRLLAVPDGPYGSEA